MKHDILEDIIAHKQIELQHQKKAVPLQTLLGLASHGPEYRLHAGIIGKFNLWYHCGI